MEYFCYNHYLISDNVIEGMSYIFLFLYIKTIIFTAESPTKIYIDLARNGTDPKIKLIMLKFNNPKSPQFNAPINTNINESLSIILSLYIIPPKLL